MDDSPEKVFKILRPAEHAVLYRQLHGRLSLGTSRLLCAREKKALSGASWRDLDLDLEDEDEDEEEDLTRYMSAERTSAERRHAFLTDRKAAASTRTTTSCST